MNIKNCFSIVKTYNKQEQNCKRCNEAKARYYIFYVDAAANLKIIDRLCKDCMVYYRFGTFINWDSIPFKLLFKQRKRVNHAYVSEACLIDVFKNRKENIHNV